MTWRSLASGIVTDRRGQIPPAASPGHWRGALGFQGFLMMHEIGSALVSNHRHLLSPKLMCLLLQGSLQGSSCCAHQ